MDLAGFDRVGYIKRVRWLRRLHDMNQTEFAAFVGVPYKKWNHYERGYPISRETAFVLRAKITAFKFDPAWLWWGDTEALSPATLARLQEFEREERKRSRASQPLPMSEVPTRISKTDRRRKKNGHLSSSSS